MSNDLEEGKKQSIGIDIQNSHGVKLENNIVSGFDVGIRSISSDNLELDSNVVYGKNDGFKKEKSGDMLEAGYSKLFWWILVPFVVGVCVLFTYDFIKTGIIKSLIFNFFK